MAFLELPSGKRLHSELENHRLEQVDQLFLWPCSSSQTVKLLEGIGYHLVSSTVG